MYLYNINIKIHNIKINMSYILAGGVHFQFLYNEIDFTHDSICCTFENKDFLIPLHNNVQSNVNVLENHELNCDRESNVEAPENLHREDSFSWTDATTKLFLTLYKEKRDLLTKRKIKTKKMVWKNIADEMKINGYNVSCLQVENKFKSLERLFKNVITHNKKTGRNKISCPYKT